MKNELFDLIIIGAGSAGMTAGIYAGRARLKTLILDRSSAGGQIKITSDVENYPGVLHASGAELSETMRKQAENFGVAFRQTVVEKVDFTGDIKKIYTVDGMYEALAVLVATGAVPRKLGFVGEEAFQGRGIGYCATCDGEFFSGLDVFVVGAGFAAAEESMFLTRYARKVTVIAREPEFTCSKMIAERVLAHPKIEVKFHTELLEVTGETVLAAAKFINNQTGETWVYTPPAGETFGVFVFVGYMPQTTEYRDQLRVDQYGYIPTDESMRTNVDGVYAAGDVRPKELRQLVTAVADGAIAATNAERYIARKRELLGLHHEEQPPATAAPAQAVFDEATRGQLEGILSRFEKPVQLVTVLDDSADWSAELKAFATEFVSLSDKLSVRFLQKGEDPALEQQLNITLYPAMVVLRGDGSPTGVQFHGIPGGHEINSFILALYNTAGPGQQVSEESLAKLRAVDKPVNIKVGVSLSCTFCPDVVTLTQLMAIQNPLVQAEMIDVARYPAFKNQYAIMSVPAIVVNDAQVTFGKRNLDQLVALAQG